MKKPIAVMGISNNLSLNIYEVNEPEDYLVVGYSGMEPQKAEIWYGDERGPSFEFENHIFYLDEFIRTDI